MNRDEKLVSLHIKMPVWLRDEIDKLAEQTGESRASLIRAFIRKGIATQKGVAQ